MEKLNVKLYADGAVIGEMKEAYQSGTIKGFTTNPSLMKKAGVTDYEAFAKEAISKIPDMSISFEVFSDDFEVMRKEAEKIAGWGDNIYVKIPISNSLGESSIPLIKDLSDQGVQLNVTAILTLNQVRETVDAFAEGTNNIVSVFAGRIADSGVDPHFIMKESAKICHQKQGTELLWASSRELLNIFQADDCGCDIITCPPEILNKIPNVGKSFEQISLETVQMFSNDSKELGFSIV